MIENPSNLTQQILNLVERVAVEIRAIYNKLTTAVFKVNGQIPDSDGNIQIDAVTKATQDGSGNVITSTYATKSELNAIDVGVKTVNGTQPDPNGNVTIQTGGDTSNLVLKTGDRGVLAGFEKFAQQIDLNNGIGLEVTINENSNDVSLAVGSVIVENGNSSGFVKGLIGVSPMPSDYFTWTKVAFLFTGASVTLGNRWLWSNGEVPNLEAGGVLVCHWNSDFGIANFISLGDEDFSGLLDAIVNEEMGGA